MHSTPHRISAPVFASALLAAAFLQVAENVIPRLPLFPWLKLGISYAVVLPFLARYGAGAAAALLIGRNAMGWLIAGQAFSTFLIGTVAAAAAFSALGPLVRFGMRRGFLGTLGAGVALATAMNLAQLVAAQALFIRHLGFYFQIPIMLLWSAVSGAVTAWMAVAATPWLHAWWDRCEKEPLPQSIPVADDAKPGRRRAVFIVTWARLALVLALPFYRLQILMCLATCLIFLLRRTSDPSERFRPFRPLLYAWPLLLFQAWLHLFHGEGVFLAGGWMTREGLHAFLLHALRLVNVILIGPRLQQLFPRGALSRSGSPYWRGLALAWERFPALMKEMPKPGRAALKSALRGDLGPLFQGLGEKLAQGSASSNLTSRSAFSKSPVE